MANNKTLSTENAGTFNLTYNAQDESGNITTKTRNVFILNKLNNPVFNLIDGDDFLNASSFVNGTYPTIQYVGSEDPGVTATDQYGNDVGKYVRIKHYRVKNKDLSSRELIYDTGENPPLNTNPTGTPITNNYDPENLWFFDTITQPPVKTQPLDPNDPNDLNLSSTNLIAWGLDGFDTFYQVEYILDLPNSPSTDSLTRTVRVSDITPPVFTLTLADYDVDQGDPANEGAGNETNAKKKFTYRENYWFVDIQNLSGSQIPENGNSADDQVDADRVGFKVEDVFYTHPNEGTKQNIDWNVKGVWTAHHRFTCIYKNDQDKVINYRRQQGATDAEIAGKYYEITRRITIAQDNEGPVIKFLNINASYTNGGKIETFSSSRFNSLSADGDYYGGIRITVPNVIGDTSDDQSLAKTLDDEDDNFKSDAGAWVEIQVTDNLTNPVTNISYTILPDDKPNYPTSATDLIRRTHLGTDFSGIFNNQNVAGINRPKIAGTSSNPSQFVITYTAIDGEGNKTERSRLIEIVDNVNPSLEFDDHSNSLYGNALTFNQVTSGSGTTTSVNAETKTSKDDNFGDSISLVFDSAIPDFRAAYPKNKLNNIFKIKYQNSGYFLTDLYDITLTGPFPLVLRKDGSSGSGTIFYFDLSDSSLSGDKDDHVTYKFFNGATELTSGVSLNPSYTPISTFNAYISIDVSQITGTLTMTIKKGSNDLFDGSAITFLVQ